MATPTVEPQIKLSQLPARELGFHNTPAIPIDVPGMLDTLVRLGGRSKQHEQAFQGLSKSYTIAGRTAPARDFLFGKEPQQPDGAATLAHLRELVSHNTLEILPRLVASIVAQHKNKVPSAGELTELPLDDARQFSISWTTFPDVQALGAPHLDDWAATVDVTQPEKATEAFWPTIATYGRTYNLILPEKVRDAGRWRELFGGTWTPAMDAAAQAGLLYVIDLRIYEALEPMVVAGATRFTPGTVTVLVQDTATKAMTPELIRVAGADNDPTVFSRQDSTGSAWVYALQAAKVSITVFGIWFGHVYQWHIVSAAMFMTMFENLSPANPVYKLLEPQSSFVIPFDGVLLLGWGALRGIPPTSISTAPQFIELIDRYADGREFFDDDPTTRLEQLGLTETDFTVDEPWDAYPIVGEMLEIWDATGRYVDTVIDQAYAADQDVQHDEEIQRWIAASGRVDDGNVRGLPPMESKDALKRVLHSLIYRVTAHGGARLYRDLNPSHTFVANFPPTLQDASIPQPDAAFDNATLLRYLPNTGTIGWMAYFYFTFWAAAPYVPYIPLAGPEADLFFEDDVSNEALIELRHFLAGFIAKFEPDTPQTWQWERNIEL